MDGISGHFWSEGASSPAFHFLGESDFCGSRWVYDSSLLGDWTLAWCCWYIEVMSIPSVSPFWWRCLYMQMQVRHAILHQIQRQHSFGKWHPNPWHAYSEDELSPKQWRGTCWFHLFGCELIRYIVWTHAQREGQVRSKKQASFHIIGVFAQQHTWERELKEWF